MEQGLTYDDVLLIPGFSDIPSRSQVDLSVDLGKGIKLKLPIISANMKHVTGAEMATEMAKLGGLGILHRFTSLDGPVEEFKKVVGLAGASVGVKPSDKDLVKALVEAGCSIICIDIAHGHSQACLDMAKWISWEYPDVLLIAGNVATASGAFALASVGVDVVKVGIGGGSICSTRIETGNGVPMITSLKWVFGEACDNFGYAANRKFKIIADGGIRSGGDVVKALCLSDAVMVGNLLARTEEAPGKRIEKNGIVYKNYHGSSTHKNSRVEGVKTLLPVEGKASDVLVRLTEGLQSGCSYQGAKNLEELKIKGKFIRITPQGLLESRPHSLS